MVETRSGEIDAAVDFPARIAARSLPIDLTDAQNFVKVAKRYTPPRGFFTSLADALDYYDKDAFAVDLEKMAHAVYRLIAGKEWTAVHLDRMKSNYWIYNQLLALGLPPATDEKFISEERSLRWGPQPININTKTIVCMDDFLVSGDQAEQMEKYTLIPYVQRNFVFLRTSPMGIAREHLPEQDIISVGTPIRHLEEVLTPEESYFIRNATLTASGNRVNLSDRGALIWAWHKVPDNVPKFFTGKCGLPPLVREDKFVPPYRQVTNH